MSLLMAKIGDGNSFRFYRFAKNFRSVAASNSGFEMKDWVDSPQFRLFSVGGRTMVPPRFWKKMAYFYLSSQDDTVDAKMVAY